MAARVMILAGGTGGHIYPALAVACELRDKGNEVLWMGSEAGMENRVVPAAGFPLRRLAVSGFRGKGWLAKLATPFRLIRACLQAGGILIADRPQVVLGMGGFVAGPGGFMARLFGIPLVIHEQNRIPGTTNRILVKWANLALEAFPGSFPALAGAHCVGNPLRREIAVAVPTEKRLDGDELKILVVGGSQGAAALNRTVPEALALVGPGVRVWHQTGQAMCQEVEEHYRRLGVVGAKVAPFIEDMAEAYRWADLAICRSGAMTVSELTAAGLPALLVPFPFAIDDHQTANARYLSEAGAAILMPQSELTGERLAAEIQSLLAQPERLADMSRQSRRQARLDAAREVASLCLKQVRP